MIKFAKNYQEAAPILLQEYREENGKGYIQFQYKGFWERLFFWLFGKPREGRIFLDTMSNSAVSKVDGHRSIWEIANMMVAEGEGEDVKDMSERLALFFGGLHQKRLIEFHRPEGK